ncbi:unnamed protein product [Triticum turgidum subsp. durum]|uniref:Uncharacterized protein n=1 Tax=Triticum turgidum subsp. durum TaxID=4567 RepID=A0A9R1P5L6_TRITD|nr:unnamed protein product [Triticum turgidum subsp. durum]
MNGLEHPRNGRTAYHFQPAKFWQNDPNGPLYHNGMYHFFYQYNPHGATWGDGTLSWGHSVSGDLVNWADVGNALDPTSPFDANGCWSGSATVLPGGRPAILYTGIDANRVQVQNVAFAKNPADPLLREWEKPDCNPVMPMPADVTGNNFRDPTEAWLGRDGLWRVGVVAEVGGVGSLLVYRSADFLRWERNAAPLHASSRDVPVLECPDLFPMAPPGAAEGLDVSASGAGVLHVLKLTDFAKEDHYMVGRYDDVEDTFVSAEPERGDDPDGKRLVQWPIEEIETLRRKRVGLQWATEVEAGGRKEVAGIVSSQADVQAVFEIPNLEEAETLDPKWLQDPKGLAAEMGASGRGGVGPFGLLVLASGDLEEHTAVFFRVFKHDGKFKVLMCTDLTRSSRKEGINKPSYGAFLDVDVEKERSISLRTLIDHTVVESFGDGGRACMTARVYPEHAATGSSRLYAFNYGAGAVKVSKLEAWELATAAVNGGGHF